MHCDALTFSYNVIRFYFFCRTIEQQTLTTRPFNVRMIRHKFIENVGRNASSFLSPSCRRVCHMSPINNGKYTCNVRVNKTKKRDGLHGFSVFILFFFARPVLVNLDGDKSETNCTSASSLVICSAETTINDLIKTNKPAERR